jgi:hypothetical protein
MKARKGANGEFLGNYTDLFISTNWNNEINGVLVSEWDLVDLYEGGFLCPVWNGNSWTEGATPSQLTKKQQDQEFARYVERQQEGMKRYLELAAEFRVNKLNGLISEEFHNTIEETLRPVRDEFVKGQFITSLEKLETIGSGVVGQTIYDQIHSSITQAIDQFYN